MFKHNSYVRKFKEKFEHMSLEDQVDYINETRERMQTQRNLFWAFIMLETTLLASNLMLLILHRNVATTLTLALITFVILCIILYIGSMYHYLNNLLMLIHVKQYINTYYSEVKYEILSQEELTRYVMEVLYKPKYNKER